MQMNRETIVDNFAGGGGASIGIALAHCLDGERYRLRNNGGVIRCQIGL